MDECVCVCVCVCVCGGGVMERWMDRWVEVEGRKKAIGQAKDGIQTQALMTN